MRPFTSPATQTAAPARRHRTTIQSASRTTTVAARSTHKAAQARVKGERRWTLKERVTPPAASSTTNVPRPRSRNGSTMPASRPTPRQYRTARTFPANAGSGQNLPNSVVHGRLRLRRRGRRGWGEGGTVHRVRHDWLLGAAGDVGVLPWLVREVDADPGAGVAGLGVDEVDGAAVQVGHPAGDGEAEAGAAATLGLRQRPEPLEDAVPVRGGDARPLVGDLQPPAGGRVVRGDPDDPTGGTVAGSVVQQVRDQLVEPGRVSRDRERGRRDADVVRHLPTGHPGLGHGALQQLEDGHLGGRQRCLAGVDPGEVEQVGDEGGEPLGLGERRPQGRGVRLGDPVDEVLEHGAQGGERSAELVAHVRHQVAALAVDGGQVLGHPVEGPGQLAHLVARGRGHPTGVVAPGHPAGGGGHLAQRRGHPHGQQLGDAERQGHGDRDAEPERHAAAGADRRDDRGHGDTGRDEKSELDLDRGDPVQQRAAHVRPRPRARTRRRAPCAPGRPRPWRAAPSRGCRPSVSRRHPASPRPRRRGCPGCRRRPGSPARQTSRSNSVGVRCTSASLTQTRRAAASTRRSPRATGERAASAGARSTRRRRAATRATSSRMRNGLVR